MRNWHFNFYKFDDGPGNYVEFIPILAVKRIPEIKWIECGSPLGEAYLPSEVIDILECFHANSDSGANAMRFIRCSEYHASVAKWLRMNAMKILKETMEFDLQQRSLGCK